MGTGQIVLSNMRGPGARVGNYELIRLIGVGGKGQVWAARDMKLGRRVAIKFMNLPNAESAARFMVEAQATAQCQHENIVVIYQVDVLDGAPYMVLEYLDGEPMDELVTKGPVSVRRAVDIGASILRALVQAHSLGIIHRDLKPANVFLTHGGTVKVLDFGMAKAVGSDTRHMPVTELTNDGAVLGTPAFMPPEQLQGKEVDEGADLWSFGVLMYNLLAGRHPLGQAITLADLIQVTNGAVPMPSAAKIPGVPPALARIVDRCVRKERSERYSCAADVLTALKPLMRQSADAAMTPGQCPYLGLSAFQEKDSARFFGRTSDTRRAVAWLDDQPIVSILGPSGAGKSSFVRAGIGPALTGSGETWQLVTTRPGRDPMLALANIIRGQLRDGASEDVVAQRLREQPGLLGRVLRRWSRTANKRVLLFIDQFEELYTQETTREDRLAYTACLAGVADDVASPLRLALAMRSDFAERVAEDPLFMDQMSRGLMFLAPLDREGLREALERPLEMAGHSFESEEMVESILDELETTAGALPLLQFAATQLWDMRDRVKSTLTEEAYRGMGGVTGALIAHADHVMADIGPAAQPRVRDLFQRLVTIDKTRDIVEMRELLEMGNDRAETQRLIERLVRARLLVVNTDAEEPTVELVHESLILNWPLLTQWIEEEKDAHAFVAQLRSTAKLWDSRDRPPGMLWRGDSLLDARRWKLRNSEENLMDREREYLAASFSADSRAKRVRRGLMVVAMTFLGMVAIGASVAMVVFNKQSADIVEKEKAKRIAAEQAERSKAKAEVAEGDRDEAYAKLEQEALKAKNEAARAKEAAARARKEAERAAAQEARANEAAMVAKQQTLAAERARKKLEDKLNYELKRRKKARLSNDL